jgi:hypothetical protein
MSVTRPKLHASTGSRSTWKLENLRRAGDHVRHVEPGKAPSAERGEHALLVDTAIPIFSRCRAIGHCSLANPVGQQCAGSCAGPHWISNDPLREISGDDHRAAIEERRRVDCGTPHHLPGEAGLVFMWIKLTANSRMDAVRADENVGTILKLRARPAVAESSSHSRVTLLERRQS